MSTAQPDGLSGEKLVQTLELDGVSFYGCKPQEFLHPLCVFVSAVWHDVDLTHYTNHDTRHSQSIIEYFLKLRQLYDWSGYERMLFAASALIHDVGMQFNRWAPLVVNARLPKRKLSSDEVRDRHVEFGHELIFGYIERRLKLGLPVPCALESTSHVTHLERAARIAFAHSGDKYRRPFIQDRETFKSRVIEKHSYRPTLLAGVLRLCDELDGNYTRLRDQQQDRISAWDVTDETRRHWFSGLFVESTDIIIAEDQKMARIIFRWQAPSGMSAADVRCIRTLLGTNRQAKIESDIRNVHDFYVACGEPEHIRGFSVDKLGSNPIRFAFPHSNKPEFKSALRKAIQARHTYRRRADHAKPKISLLPEKAFEQPLESEADIKQSLALPKKPLNQWLEGWFSEHGQPGHFGLVSGEHTDTYLNCRAIVSNQELLREIANHIYDVHCEHGIDAVLAVGTSAIPIAVNVAHRLACAVSFTMYSDRRYSRNINEDYHPIELDPTTKRGQKILIVDDIISGGRVVQKVLDILWRSNRAPAKVFHQAIFRLGRRRYFKDTRVAQYSHIVRIRNIYYALSASRCALCSAGINLLNETDMH